MNRIEADELLFGDDLACTELRPASFAPAPDAAQLRHHLVRSETLLRALAAVEDNVRHDDADSPSESAALHRVEAKLELLTTMVASLARQDADPVRDVRWSVRGAVLALGATHEIGSSGLFRMQLADWLPLPLVLPANVIAGDGAHTWLQFTGLSPALQDALERHLFRVHRREIAESRGSTPTRLPV